jgi:DNA-binding transcriptional regulator YhcF (GntR family)
MRFWFARDSEVPIREQLVTQVILGILSAELVPGERLPSTRELARRFHLHPNTVSAAYRQLGQERWLESRRGSGVYVRTKKPEAPLSPARALDQQIAALFRASRDLGVSRITLRKRLDHWLAMQAPDHFLVIEPDEDLREIVIEEVRQVVTFPVVGGGFDVCRMLDVLAGAIPVVLPSKLETAREALPAGTEILALQVRSIPSSLAEWVPATPGLLIGVASRWSDFLKSAHTMLIAAGFPAESLVLRDARRPSWQRGLKQTAAVVCDTLTAKKIPAGCRVISFAVLAEASLEELRRYQRFIERPISEML